MNQTIKFAKFWADLHQPKEFKRAKQSQDRGFEKFMQLPLEIREKVWDFSIRGKVYFVPRSYHLDEYARYFLDPLALRGFVQPNTIGPNPKRPPFLPAVCRVSVYTFEETLGVFLRNTNFLMHNIAQNRFFDAFLTKVDGFRSIRTLSFGYFDCFPSGFERNADLELAARCPGLQELSSSFHANQLEIFEDEAGDPSFGLLPREPDEMWSHYRMDRLLDCEQLEVIKINHKGWRSNANTVFAAEGLATRIAREFLVRKGRVVGAEIMGL